MLRIVKPDVSTRKIVAGDILVEFQAETKLGIREVCLRRFIMVCV